MNTLSIYFNGEPRSVPEGTTLQQALALLTQADGAAPPAPIATALNGSHVARARREQTLLAAGDHITTFQAIVGG
ncbi:sulfur carrier protein ThiS [uncultured Castellaniella sp.]|jgi:sulfur carrier protein|uniref:sulfur carrier protein ThiS n=1 Tax=uncultured Castellaniella sp. TaxID=647907 RepID=UPI00262DBE2E|nr:sulfur carrier protein ThiS [uncultured Castellaniella sp.]